MIIVNADGLHIQVSWLTLFCPEARNEPGAGNCCVDKLRQYSKLSYVSHGLRQLCTSFSGREEYEKYKNPFCYELQIC